MSDNVIDLEQYRSEKEDTEKTYDEPSPYKRGRKDKKHKYLGLKTAGAVLAVVIIMLSPLFDIKSINVTEMVAYSKSEICDAGDIKEGENLFLTALTAGGRLEKDPYFKNVDISISLPSTLNVNVEERRVRGYISYMGSYLYIDEYGLVMDSRTNFKENLPVFTGLEFSKFKVGEVLEVEREEILETVVELTQIFTLYDALEKVDSVDVKDTENITVTAGGVKVRLGQREDLDQKIRTMKEILAQLGEEERGTLDISDLSKPIIFKYLT